MNAAVTEHPISPSSHPRARALYFLSALVSLVFLVGIGLIWYRVYNAPPSSQFNETIVMNAAEAASYLKSNLPPDLRVQPILIPTGVVMQSVEFTGPFTVQISGFIWQKYADTLPQDLNKAVVLPEAESETFTEVYHAHEGTVDLIGWSFKATLRESFDYGKYPLDRQQIRMRIWSADFTRNVYLIPDAESYTSLDPATFPGIDPGVIMVNWEMQRSYFSFRQNRYNSNFGVLGDSPSESLPELYFNISLKRFAWGALLAWLLVPLVILVLLYVVVLLVDADDSRLHLYATRPGPVIFSCASFAFAVVLGQNALRAEIQSPGLVYLESFHIVTYLAILAVALNVVALVASPPLRRLSRNDNFVVELLYGPVILGILFFVTLWVFR